MLDLAAVRAAFPELAALTPLVQSGQKDVLHGERAGEQIVLKILRATTAEAEARMVREIGAVARLRCAYVPPVRDSGRRRIGNDDRNFIVESFMSGETYRDRLSRQPIQPLRDVLSLADVLDLPRFGGW